MNSKFQNIYSSVLDGELKNLKSMIDRATTIPALFNQKKTILMEALRKGYGAQPQYHFDVYLDWEGIYEIPTIQNVSDFGPDITFKYDKTKGGVVPNIEDFQNMSISYWDFNTEEITKNLWKCYEAQLNNGLFDITKVPKHSVIFNFSSNFTATFVNCYMERPMRRGFQTSAGLAGYSFNFAFEDIDFKIEDKTPDTSVPKFPSPLNI